MKMFMTMAALTVSMLVGVAEMKQGMQLVHEAVQQQNTEMRLIKQMTNEAYGMNVEPTANATDSTAPQATPYSATPDNATADNGAPEVADTNPAQAKADADMLALVDQAARMQLIKQMTNGATGTYTADNNNGGQQ